jgi:ATP-binding cassette subfamily C (CFTR/MRP) protein 1
VQRFQECQGSYRRRRCKGRLRARIHGVGNNLIGQLGLAKDKYPQMRLRKRVTASADVNVQRLRNHCLVSRNLTLFPTCYHYPQIPGCTPHIFVFGRVVATYPTFIMKCSPISDNAFGPRYCDNFDFTLTFEQSFFQIAPCALLLLALPFRASQLRRQEVKCARSLAHLCKQAIILFLALSQCALLISWALSKNASRIPVAAASLSLLTCLGLLWLSSLEHTHSASPSDIISAFIFITIFLDVPQARTLWLRHHSDTAIAATFTACLVIKIVILFLEARFKGPWLLPPYRAYAPEALTNIFDRTVLWWLGPLFLLAYQKIIKFEDLYAIDDSLLSESVEDRFMQYWSRFRK